MYKENVLPVTSMASYPMYKCNAIESGHIEGLLCDV